MKKTKLLLIIAVIIFSTMICYSMSAFALTEGDWEFQLLDNEVTITKYIGEGADVQWNKNGRVVLISEKH